jgi:surface polysaccharide O-acyltransferase-like enzyme
MAVVGAEIASISRAARTNSKERLVKAAPSDEHWHAGADALRILATLGVIAIHVSTWFALDSNLNQYPYRVIASVSDWSVPAFVVLAGFLLARRYGQRRPGLAYGVRRARRTLLPWLVWAPLIFVFTLTTDQLAGGSTAIWSWWEAGAGHLYFLLLIPQLYLIFLLWPRNHRLIIACVAMAFQIGVSAFRLYGPSTSGGLDTVTIWYGFLFFPYWIGYFGIGVAMKEIADLLRTRKVAVVAGTLLSLIGVWIALTVSYRGANSGAYAGGTGAFITPTMPVFVTGICLLFLCNAHAMRHLLNTGGRHLMHVLGQYSLGVYIIHPLVLYLAAEGLNHFLFTNRFDGVLGFIILGTVTLVISAALAVALQYTPIAFSLGLERHIPARLRKISVTKPLHSL